MVYFSPNEAYIILKDDYGISPVSENIKVYRYFINDTPLVLSKETKTKVSLYIKEKLNNILNKLEIKDYELSKGSGNADIYQKEYWNRSNRPLRVSLHNELEFKKIIEYLLGSDDFIREAFNKKVKLAFQDDVKIRRARLQEAPRKPNSKQVNSQRYDRNPDVVAERLFLAKGICGECKNRAPFISKSTNLPYLEVHHIISLSENGDDTVENTIALCPNCHRKRHFG